MNDDEKTRDYNKAVAAFAKRYLPYKQPLLKTIENFSPELADVVIRHGLYEIWEEMTPLLSYRDKEIATLAALITDNTVMKEITAHTENCLIQGMSKKEVLEILTVLTLYIGVPKIINVMDAVKQAFENYDQHIKNKG
ncbi:hypothetical protein AYO45_01060 [Gammaproteobacteria bacterium SCGC AG-212-F23]|nr:hypothetical protein AYO45_01060 [Gammaproteobacteria bacterium SCGC AG-212-F23]